MCIDDTAPQANASLPRLIIYAQICIHIHIHMYIHAYVYIYIYTCIYVHMYMFVHIHTYTYIHTHVRHIHMYTRKHAWNYGVAATAREARLESRKLHPSPCPRSSSHHHDMAPPGLHPLIYTGAGPIQPIHASSNICTILHMGIYVYLYVNICEYMHIFVIYIYIYIYIHVYKYLVHLCHEQV